MRIDGKFSHRGRASHQGVTYGPFALIHVKSPFRPRAHRRILPPCKPSASMRSAYHVPPGGFEPCGRARHDGLVDVPGPSTCVFWKAGVRREARRRCGTRRGSAEPSACGLRHRQRIPPNIVRRRWCPRQRFLRELSDAVQQTDPRGLCTYASYPSTEYWTGPRRDLQKSTCDVDTFRTVFDAATKSRRRQAMLLGNWAWTLRFSETIRPTAKTNRRYADGPARQFRVLWTDEVHGRVPDRVGLQRRMCPLAESVLSCVRGGHECRPAKLRKSRRAGRRLHLQRGPDARTVSDFLCKPRITPIVK